MNRKTVLITGACINTGVDIVKKFATEGWNIVFTGRKAETVHAKEKEYQAEFPNVKIIGYQAFMDCINLRVVELHKDIEEIEDSAFAGCSNLEKVFLHLLHEIERFVL